MTTVSTGNKCPESGVYKCQTHPSQTIPLAKGNIAPPCASTGHGTTWVLVHKA